MKNKKISRQRKNRWNRTSLLFLIFIITIDIIQAMTVEELKCEYRVNPLGIDAEKPRLSWILNSTERGDIQTAYQILVSSTKDGLTESSADMWNSGKLN